MKNLYRSKNNKIVFGVCGGIGEYFNVDPTIIRLLFVLVMLMNFGVSFLGSIIVYIIAWLIVPEEGTSGDERAPASVKGDAGQAEPVKAAAKPQAALAKAKKRK
jgi:phage shock protein C